MKWTLGKNNPFIKTEPSLGSVSRLQAIEHDPFLSSPAPHLAVSAPAYNAPKGIIQPGTTRLFHRTINDKFEKFANDHAKSEHSFAGNAGHYFSADPNDKDTKIFGHHIVSANVSIHKPVPVVELGSEKYGKYPRAVVPVKHVRMENNAPSTQMRIITDLTNPSAWKSYSHLDSYDKPNYRKNFLKEAKIAAKQNRLVHVFDYEKMTKEDKALAQNAGYDGIIWNNPNNLPGKPPQAVAFEPEQVQVLNHGQEPISNMPGDVPEIGPIN